MRRAIIVVIGLIASASACWAAGTYGTQGPAPWWSDRAAGLYGGIGGAVIGFLGAIVGILASMGKAGRFVVGLVKGLVVTGVISLIAGVVALAKGQPYAVYYPLLLTGFILTLVMGLNIRGIEARYRQIEEQQMRVRDARDGGGA